jgi:flagellar biosynthesis/type III secretory pathway chaperone
MENFDLSKALLEANDLKGLLEQEFESLKKQDINGFEKLQSRKAEILTFLSDDRLSDIVKSNPDSESAKMMLGTWDKLMGIISECKDLHRRNEIFINRKLESIKGALKTIQTPDPLNSVEVYDRLGKVRNNKVRQNMGKA